VIIDQYYPDYDGRAWLYTRWRDDEGNLIEQNISPEEFEPYFWIPADTRRPLIDKVLSRFPGSRVEWGETSVSVPDPQYGHTKLVKIVAHKPSEIKGMRDEFSRTYEADMRYADRYLIDTFPEFPEWTPRVWHFDIEAVYVGTKEELCTVICVNDSVLGYPVVFAWNREQEDLKERGHPSAETLNIDRVGGYEMRLFGSEGAVLEAFIQFMDECDPDVLVAHGANYFDVPHLVRRLGEDFRRLSPIGMVRRPPKTKGYYDDTDQPILGRIVFDSAARGNRGSGFERVWMDSGRGQLPNRKLNTIAQELGIGAKHDVNAADWTIWEGGNPDVSFWDYVDYCVQDTILLRDIDKRLHALDFFLALQRLCGVCFESTHNVTKFFRGLIGRRTEWKARTRRKDSWSVKGAYIPPPDPGRYEGVGVVDYKGLYPSIILGNNLSYETFYPGEPTSKELEEGSILVLPNGTAWNQREKGLLPQIVEELFALRDQLKANMKAAKTEEERTGWDIFQKAVKRVMASLYGMTAHAGYGWAAQEIASSITAVGRESIHFLLKEAEEQGYRALYGHTDSSMIQVPLDEAPALAAHLTEKVQSELNSRELVVELEAYFPYWTVAKKNRYFGIKSWPPEEAGQMKVAGYEYKASHAAPVSKEVQSLIFTLISEGKEESEIVEAVRPLAASLLKGSVGVDTVSSWTRLGKNPKDYNPSHMPNGAKAAFYYNQNISKGDKFKQGDSVPWVYISDVPEGKPPSKVVAYMDESDLEGYTLDWTTMVDKLILSKITVMEEAMGWDSKRAVGKPAPKRYW
tara:strand:+ start:10111 stop:12510 length:2400 start_codon:yes stop_codon:yes gene_type:complete